MQHEFSFEEIIPHINGKRVTGWPLHGKATLAQDDLSDDKTAFFVSEVEIDGGFIIRPRDRNPILSQIFDAVAKRIEDASTKLGQAAAEEFASLVTSEPDPDRAYDERRDRQAMGWVGA